MKIAFLLYPTAQVRPDEDSSFWIMHELALRKHSVFHFESKDLVLINDRPAARLSSSQTNPKTGFIPTLPQPFFADLETLDAVFVRKEPPFNEEYVTSLQILARLNKKVLVLNSPAGILLCNEKLGIRSAAPYFPSSFCSSNPADLESFARSIQGPIVIKPMGERSGYGVIATSWKDQNFRSILESASQRGQRRLLAQSFVKPGKSGERRILVLDGDILGVFRRRAHARDFRANLGLGGSMHRAAISPLDRQMVRDMAAELNDLGLYFVGIDACGDKILEINVTSPSGIPELNALNRTRIEKKVADFIERRWADRKRF